jgi:hypothetical protein
LIEGCVASLSLRVCLLSVHRFNVSQIFFPLFLFARDGKEYYLAGKVRENRVEEKDRRGVGREKVEDKSCVLSRDWLAHDADKPMISGTECS